MWMRMDNVHGSEITVEVDVRGFRKERKWYI